MSSTISRIGKYELRGVLARTSFSTVYDGWDADIARRVAIKMMPLSAVSDSQAREAFIRFKRGAQAAGQLNHRNIVAVYDYGETDAQAYFVMEFVEGPTLKSLLDKGQRFDLANLCYIVGCILDALQYSHDRAVVHRDVKPANIMFTKDNTVKILDFGIARLEDSEMTQAGTVIGTPAYMSPEQFLGEKIDWRTDIYSTGVVLYQMLTGERPYEGSLTTIMHRVLYESPLVPSRRSTLATPAIDAVVTRAMARNPQHRFGSAAEFNAALQALVAPAGSRAGSALSSRTVIFAAVAVSVLAATGAGGWYAYKRFQSAATITASQGNSGPAKDAVTPPVTLANLAPERNRGDVTSSPPTASSTDPASAALPAPKEQPPLIAQPDPAAGTYREPAEQIQTVAPPEPGPREVDTPPPPPLPPPPVRVPVKPGLERGAEATTPVIKKLAVGAGNPRSNTGPQPGRPSPDRRSSLSEARNGKPPPDTTGRPDPDAQRRYATADESSTGTARPGRQELASRTSPGDETPRPAPSYATTSISPAGLVCQTITAEAAARLGLDHAQGMLVVGLTVGSAAAKAGIRDGDVILKIRGADAQELSALSTAAAGQTVPVEILRHGNHQVLQVRMD